MDPLENYRKAAQVTAQIDYANKKSIRANNRAVNEMYRIVKGAVGEGEASVATLYVLLDEPATAPWIAHQLLELANVPPEIEERCLGIIQKLAENSLGEQRWLKDYMRKRGAV